MLNKVARRKMNFAGHVMRGSSGLTTLVVLEGYVEGKIRQGRQRTVWMHDIKAWTGEKKYDRIKRTAENREKWRSMSANLQITEEGTE